VINEITPGLQSYLYELFDKQEELEMQLFAVLSGELGIGKSAMSLHLLHAHVTHQIKHVLTESKDCRHCQAKTKGAELI